MDFSIDLSLDPMSYVPTDLLGWGLQIIPAALAVWTEKSGVSLPRRAYFWALFRRVIGVIVLSMIVLGILPASSPCPRANPASPC